MSASEEFIRLVHLRGALECAQATYDEFFDENDELRQGVDADMDIVFESAEDLVLANSAYRRSVMEYSVSRGFLFTRVDKACEKACEELARHDRAMADIEFTLSRAVIG